MKRLSLLIALAALAALSFPGCITVDGQRKPDLERIARVVKEAATQTAEEMLFQRPDWADEFQAAHAELVRLETAPSLGVNDLLAVISRIPLKELRSDEARIAIRGARLIIAITGWSEVAPERLAQLRVIVKAMREGLEQGGVVPGGAPARFVGRITIPGTIQ